MTMPTSIFNFLPSNNPKSIASSLLNGQIPNLPKIPSLAGIGLDIPPQLSTPESSGSSGTNSATPLVEFLADIQSHGIAWNNRFYMRMTPPPLIDEVIRQVEASKARSIDPWRLTLRCEATELPGVTFATAENRFSGGPAFRSAVGVAYTDLTLQFLLSADYTEKYFFDYWQSIIKDSSDLYGYHSDYTTDIELTTYTQQNDAAYGVRFHDAWPIAINPISLSWEDQSLMRLSITFSYTRWEAVDVPNPPVYTGSPSDPSNTGNGSQNLLADFAFGILPSIPNGAKILGVAGMSSRDLMRAGTSLLGNAIKTKDPVSRTIIGAGTSTINKFLGG